MSGEFRHPLHGGASGNFERTGVLGAGKSAQKSPRAGKVPVMPVAASPGSSGKRDGVGHDRAGSHSKAVNALRRGAPSQGLRILLVEDSDGDADLCRAYLEEGFGSRAKIVRVTRLRDVQEALDQHDMDVVLLDLGLPDSMGVQSVVAVRRMAADVPIVVLTGNRDAQLGVQVIQEHAQDYCAKQDLNPALLTQSIRHAIERHRLQTQYARLLESSPDGIVVLDQDNKTLFANQTACEMLGLNPLRCVGTTLPMEFAAPKSDEIVLPNRQVAEIRSVPVDWNKSPSMLYSYRDITARKQAESRLQQMVQYDELTGLANRNFFFDCLGRLVGGIRREGGMLAMLFMDLDRFKYINDTMGHDAGDELLRQVGKRLSNSVRQGDLLARLGGDEFALILNHIAGPEQAAHVAQKLLQNLEKPLAVHGSKVSVGMSIGIATYPQCGNNVQDIYRAADTAMYRAKEQGKNQFQFFADHMQHRVEERIRIEQAVRRVAADDAFWLAYQPQVRARDGMPVGVEALLRWPDHAPPVFTPAEFIPVAEDIGLINGIGRNVLHSAATMAAQTGRLLGLPLRVAVNVSMRQLYAEHLYSEIETVLNATGLPPDRLEVELTESSVMGDPVRAQRTLAAIRTLGVSVAIDDFGTGYSSMNYLRRLPVDVLKIDRSFVAEIGRNPETEAILHSQVHLARALGLNVVAEGVETAEQWDFLVGAGCDCLQGYYVCRPDTQQRITDWLCGSGSRGS